MEHTDYGEILARYVHEDMSRDVNALRGGFDSRDEFFRSAHDHIDVTIERVPMAYGNPWVMHSIAYTLRGRRIEHYDVIGETVFNIKPVGTGTICICKPPHLGEIEDTVRAFLELAGERGLETTLVLAASKHAQTSARKEWI